MNKQFVVNGEVYKSQNYYIDINGAIAGEIPAVDKLDKDPVTTIKTGDWVEIDAPEVGEKATVTVTRKG